MNDSTVSQAADQSRTRVNQRVGLGLTLTLLSNHVWEYVLYV